MNRLTCCALFASLLGGTTSAQTVATAPPTQTNIRASIEKLTVNGVRSTPTLGTQQATQSTRGASKVKYGIGFGVLGAVLGASIGASLTHNCKCEDPNNGILYGFPIGAAVGAVVGVLIAR